LLKREETERKFVDDFTGECSSNSNRKFLAAFTVFLTMTALTAIFPIIISIKGELVLSAALSSYLGFILLGASFVAFGLFTSSITESQIIAAVLGTVTLFFILLIDQLKLWFPDFY